MTDEIQESFGGHSMRKFSSYPVKFRFSLVQRTCIISTFVAWQKSGQTFFDVKYKFLVHVWLDFAIYDLTSDLQRWGKTMWSKYCEVGHPESHTRPSEIPRKVVSLELFKNPSNRIFFYLDMYILITYVRKYTRCVQHPECQIFHVHTWG